MKNLQQSCDLTVCIRSSSILKYIGYILLRRGIHPIVGHHSTQKIHSHNMYLHYLLLWIDSFKRQHAMIEVGQGGYIYKHHNKMSWVSLQGNNSI